MSDGFSRRRFLAGGGAAATTLAVGDTFGRLVPGDEADAVAEAARRPVSGAVTLTEGSMIQLAVSPEPRDDPARTSWGSSGRCRRCGGHATKLSGLYTDPAYPSWSPRGDWIAFQSYMGGTFHIWTMRPGRN